MNQNTVLFIWELTFENICSYVSIFGQILASYLLSGELFYYLNEGWFTLHDVLQLNSEYNYLLLVIQFCKWYDNFGNFVQGIETRDHSNQMPL